MEKKIMYTENAPEKKFLWLHHKNGDLVLEGFGNNGWESVGKENLVVEQKEIINKEELIAEITAAVKPEKTTAIKMSFPKLTEDCSKKELIRTIEKLKNALVKAGIIEI